MRYRKDDKLKYQELLRKHEEPFQKYFEQEYSSEVVKMCREYFEVLDCTLEELSISEEYYHYYQRTKTIGKIINTAKDFLCNIQKYPIPYEYDNNLGTGKIKFNTNDKVVIKLIRATVDYSMKYPSKTISLDSIKSVDNAITTKTIKQYIELLENSCIYIQRTGNIKIFKLLEFDGNNLSFEYSDEALKYITAERFFGIIKKRRSYRGV